MDIIGINYKVNQPNNVEKYLDDLEKSIKRKPEILVGPDYALTPFTKNWKIDFSKNNEIYNNLEQISSVSPETLLIPGTIPDKHGEKEMRHFAPVFFKGRKLDEFDKETDVENSYVAKENGLKYRRGDFTRNKLEHLGKKIAVEICSDHGKQPIDKDTFLELILSYDQKAGFWIRPNNDDFSRYAIVCDGQQPLVDGFFYNPASINKMDVVIPQKLNSREYLFSL